jgi:hypothetical protein
MDLVIVMFWAGIETTGNTTSVSTLAVPVGEVNAVTVDF